MKKLIYRIFLTANIFFASGLVLSYLAVHINPDTFALPALFGLAYPYLLLVNIVFVILWAAAMRFESLISVAVIALGITHFSNYIKIRKPSGDKAGTFRVQSYNVRLFNNFESRKNSSSEKNILNLLRNQQSEIICLQEVYVNGDPLLKESSMKSTLGKGYSSHVKFIRSGKNRYYGIVTITRFPIVGKGDIVHPGSSSLSIYTDIVVANDTFRVFNNHLQSFHLRRMEQSFINELTEASGEKEPLDEIRDLSVSLRSGFARRARQAQAVKEWINKSPYPVIVAGDFNDTPVSYSYRKIRKGLNDSFVAAGYGAGFTYRGNYPPNRIDYILFDNTLQCRQFDIVKVRYSDHYPIIAYFRKAD